MAWPQEGRRKGLRALSQSRTLCVRDHTGVGLPQCGLRAMCSWCPACKLPLCHGLRAKGKDLCPERPPWTRLRIQEGIHKDDAEARQVFHARLFLLNDYICMLNLIQTS